MTRVTIHLDGSPKLAVTTDLSRGTSIALELDFDGEQPRAFGLSKATSQPLKLEDFVTSVAQGGAVNCMQLTLWPHGNGTHTETVGHLLKDPPPIGRIFPGFQLALVLTVSPETLGLTQESYPSPALSSDRVISLRALKDALRHSMQHTFKTPPELPPTALVIRTLPNILEHKRAADYSDTNPPYLTAEAMRWVRHELEAEHLLIDLPSVDREHDQGKLSNHRCFWDVGEAHTTLAQDHARRLCTITEMVYVPDTIQDGLHLLQIELPALRTDAAPSRPILYPID